MATFSDIDRNFDPDRNGDIRIATDEVALDHAIRNILSTSPGERYLRPEFGSRLREILGEQMDDQTRRFLRTEIERALRQEERISFERLSIEFRPAEHSVIAEIVWTSAVTFSEKQSTVEISLGG